MYGKIFSSLFTGSMYGAGAPKFAMMSYVIANMKPDKEVGFQVELNVKDLASRLGEPAEVIQEAVDYLCAPDPESRSSAEEGRRLVKIGAFDYRVVNGAHYANLRSEEARREYNRNRQKNYREKKKKATGVPQGTLLPDPNNPTPSVVKFYEEARIALHWLNQKAGKNFREVAANLDPIARRLREVEGDLEGIKKMIERQCSLWLNTQQAEYLRPSTLFKTEKFTEYYDLRGFPVEKHQNGGTNRPKVDRNAGTLNRPSDYEAVGRRVPVELPDIGPTTAGTA